MSGIAAIATYAPAWAKAGRRLSGPDEDGTTMAVAAAMAIGADRVGAVSRVVVVSRDPETTDATMLPVITRALGLADDVPAELRVGGAPVTLDALCEAAARSLVIAVDPVDQPGAAAALVDTGGLGLAGGQVRQDSLPVHVRWSGSATAASYGDARVERELGWRPVVAQLAADGQPTFVVGVPPSAAKRLGGEPIDDMGVAAPAPIRALAWMAEQQRTGCLVAVYAGVGRSVEVTAAEGVQVVHEVRPAVSAEHRPAGADAGVTIPVSMPAYHRAFQAKVGFVAARCSVCGAVSYPPRSSCPECASLDAAEPFPLPRTGEVYSVVTVHVPIPGVSTPCGLALVSVDGVAIRVLAHVTDVGPTACRIGDRGRLVLRRIAVREGIPDYGYAFQPEVSDAERVGVSA